MSNTRIIKLTAENVKRLSCVEITPNGNVVQISGANGAGKSSVIDSIEYALAGAGALPSVPVRRGQERAEVVVELEDLIVRRTFTAEGGTSLTVSNKEGARYPSPQAILDALVGRLSFDPLAFARQDGSEQSETLRSLVGIDFEKQDADRATIFADRTVVGREVKSLEARFAALPEPQANTPDDEQSTAAILQQQQNASEKNAENDRQRSQVGTAQSNLDRVHKNLADVKEEMDDLEKKLGMARARWGKLESELIDAEKQAVTITESVKSLVDEDLTQFADKLTAVENTNRLVREKKNRASIQNQMSDKRKEYQDLTDKIDVIEKEKSEAIQKAKYPIDGLSFNETGEVMFNGLPFSQASSAEQLKVSVAIGLALNPRLKVLLIRDGSLLDEDSMKALADQAVAADAQLWIEICRTDGTVSVIIEDGHVKGVPPPAEPAVEQPATEPKKPRKGKAAEEAKLL